MILSRLGDVASSDHALKCSTMVSEFAGVSGTGLSVIW